MVARRAQHPGRIWQERSRRDTALSRTHRALNPCTISAAGGAFECCALVLGKGIDWRSAERRNATIVRARSSSTVCRCLFARPERVRRCYEHAYDRWFRVCHADIRTFGGAPRPFARVDFRASPHAGGPRGTQGHHNAMDSSKHGLTRRLGIDIMPEQLGVYHLRCMGVLGLCSSVQQSEASEACSRAPGPAALVMCRGAGRGASY